MELLLIIAGGFVLSALAPWACRWGPRRSAWIMAAVPAGLTAYFLAAPESSFRVLWVPALGLPFSLALDELSRLFSSIITGVGALIFIYSGDYLRDEPNRGRFFASLAFFMASMLGVVLAGDAVTLFVFWELTSVSSYLLIGFHHEKPESRDAAWMALLVTSLGGLSLLAGFILLQSAAGAWSFDELATRHDAILRHAAYAPIVILILVGAMTKSAQVPFHFWLPNAMQAPTPVSAYLHSATMVKAGIYVMVRMSPVLGGTDLWELILCVVGTSTLLVGAYQSVLQQDLKLILAYSTVGVLGLLTLLIGAGTPDARAAMILYLAAHAGYKGALFLVAGAVDHATGERRVDRLGGLARKMPVAAAAALVAAASMAGLPPLLGFVGKEASFEALMEDGRWLSTGAVWIGSIFFVWAAGLAAVRPFFGAPTVDAHASPLGLWLGGVVLASMGLVLLFGEPLFGTPVSLWHGWSVALALGAASWAAGAALTVKGEPLRRRLPQAASWSPERLYSGVRAGLISFAELQTRVLQNGLLRVYLLITFAAFLLAVLVALVLSAPRLELSQASKDIGALEIGLGLIVLAAALFTLRIRSRVGAVVGLGVIGAGVALFYVLFSAPDLAMTQVLVEVLAVFLFVLVFYSMPRTPQPRDPSPVSHAILSLLVGGTVAAVLLIAIAHQFRPPVSEYFVERSVPEGHGRNVVNVILVDFRALDTLGEITVLTLAALGVFTLLRAGPRKETPS